MWDSAGGWATVGGLVIEIITIIFILARYVAKLNVKLEEISSEHRPNHGTSMRDAITRIEKTVVDIEKDVHVIDRKLAKLEGKFEQHVEESTL